ncbi:MAG: phosphatidate cytidylyltransferase [Mariprofundaceae bacterium]|nr:phosphatidate cytidylyltransferase [Mariprofundaceae bacterium]
MSELLKRVLTASILLPLAIWWLAFSASPWFEWIAAALGFFACLEFILLLKLKPKSAWILLCATIFLWLALEKSLPLIFSISMIASVVLFLFHVEEDMAQHWQRSLMFQWLLLWVVLFIWVLIELQTFPDGRKWLFGAFIGVWLADIGAYFVGRRFGKHKLCPLVSPGKSIEGFVGGIIISVPVVMYIWLSELSMHWLFALLLAVLLATVSVLGDLAESACKRVLGTKDSSKLLPGHGGILDRIDALIPAIAITGMLWMQL